MKLRQLLRLIRSIAVHIPAIPKLSLVTYDLQSQLWLSRMYTRSNDHDRSVGMVLIAHRHLGPWHVAIAGHLEVLLKTEMLPPTWSTAIPALYQ